MTVEAFIDLGTVQTPTQTGDEVLRAKNPTYQMPVSVEIPVQLADEAYRTRESLQRSTSEWKINEDQFRSAGFEPLLQAGYVPVVPIIKDGEEKSPEMLKALKLQSEFIEVVYLWKRDEIVTGNELTILEPKGEKDGQIEEDQLPSVFPVLLCDIGRDENEISDSPARILDGSWKKTWAQDLAQTLRSTLSEPSEQGEVLIPNIGPIVDSAVRDYKHHVMAQNYLRLITYMKENETFPDKWDYKKRLKAWEENTEQKKLKSAAKEIKTSAREDRREVNNSSLLSNDSLITQAVSMAARLGYSPDKVPNGLIKKYIELRNRSFPTEVSTNISEESNIFKRPRRKSESKKNTQTQTTGVRTPVPSDQEVFAKALAKCGMPNRRKDFMKLYPNIFPNIV